MSRSTLYDVPAPAKVNLFLHVVGRRPDGYHLLQTVFRFIDLHDTLHFESRRDGVLSREAGSNDTVPVEHDLVMRAAHALQRATGTRQGASIRYHKRIPAGAGLGGGSSDAATTLLALNRLWGTGLRRDALMRLAATLGADVPVFVFGQTAFAEGVGDQLQALPAPLPERAYLLACPAEPVSTQQVFQDEHLTRNTKPITIADFCSTLCVREAGTVHQVLGGGYFGRNDLEQVVFKHHPQVAGLARKMQCCGWQPRMSGAGGSCFVEFPTLRQAQLARHQFLAKITPDGLGASAPLSVWSCAGLEAHPLQGWVGS